MHTDATLTLLESQTEVLFDKLRHFSDKMCAAFDTQELKREAEARERRRAKAESAGKGKPKNKPKGKGLPSGSEAASEASGRRKKQYDITSVKHHFLPDYVREIREFGTTDSYSTEPVRLSIIGHLSLLTYEYFQPELEHRKPKSRYVRTSRKLFTRQLANLERRQVRIRRIRERLYKNESRKQETQYLNISPEIHHHIGKTENDFVDIGVFLRRNAGDPAIHVCLTCIRLILSLTKVTFF